MNYEDLLEGTVNSIAMVFFLAGIIVSFLVYRRKKTATNLLLIILFTVGYFYSLGEVLEAFTTWYDAEEFSEFFTIFLSIIILLIGVTAFFEYQLRESEQKLYEQKIKEKMIKEQIEKLEEIDQLRTDFLRSTSHELKTPLLSIFTSSKYLLDTYKDDLNKEILEIIKVINRGSNRLKKLIENILIVNDIEINRLDLRKNKENLSEIVNECIKDMELLLKERELNLKSDINDKIFINIDKIKIEQVILNILLNAIKNTPPHGLLYVRLKYDNHFAELMIKDTGIGFTEAEQEIVFKKFGKIERQIRGTDIISEGTGLGLYLSQEIVNLHNGKIWLESEGRDKGSTFIVKLPISNELL